MNELYGSVSGCSNLESISVTEGHTTQVSTAIINCGGTSLDLGDNISVDIGYVGDHSTVFTGYVKQIDRQSPDGKYSITAYDKMTRAVDYFIASSDPDTPFSRSNISAEQLVRDLMNLAGLTDYSYTPTYFIFATTNPIEINLVTAYDYSSTIADILSWHLWADKSGTINFKNRKPFPMTGSSGQPGDTTDETGNGDQDFDINDTMVLNANYSFTEKNLRNRVVVYGATGVHAESSSSSPYLPAGFYKTVVFASPLITRQADADSAASYNLNLLNKIEYWLNISVIGDSSIEARQIARFSSTKLGLSASNWYVYSNEHNWSKSGYMNNLVLTK